MTSQWPVSMLVCGVIIGKPERLRATEQKEPADSYVDQKC